MRVCATLAVLLALGQGCLSLERFKDHRCYNSTIEQQCQSDDLRVACHWNRWSCKEQGVTVLNDPLYPEITGECDIIGPEVFCSSPESAAACNVTAAWCSAVGYNHFAERDEVPDSGEDDDDDDDLDDDDDDDDLDGDDFDDDDADEDHNARPIGERRYKDLRCYSTKPVEQCASKELREACRLTRWVCRQEHQVEVTDDTSYPEITGKCDEDGPRVFCLTRESAAKCKATATTCSLLGYNYFSDATTTAASLPTTASSKA